MDMLTDLARLELSMREIKPGGEFVLPSEWGPAHAKQYEKLAVGARLPGHLRKLDGGLALTKRLLDPVLADESKHLKWDHRNCEWTAA